MHRLGIFVTAFIAVAIVAVCSAADSQTIYSGLTIRSAERVIDLTSQVARHKVNLSLSNTGTSSTSEFFVTVETSRVPNLSLLRVKSNSGETLKVTPAHVKGKYQYYRVDLGKTLSSQDTADVVVELAFAHSMRPQPAEISQHDNKQLVVYEDNVFFTSPYQVASQKTSVKLPVGGNVVDATEFKPNSAKGNTLVYGSYEDRNAFATHPLRLHFENNEAFLTLTSLNKVVEVSHWGNVNVEDWVEMRNDGAKLRGEFSRFDYRRVGKGPHVRAVTQYLPLDARDIYYRDEIGNISTSAIQTNDDNLLLELTPRFPLFGGWKTKYYMGYDLPLAHYLFTDSRDSSLYVLNVSFALKFDVDAVIDNFEFKVILPEGAKDIKAHVPFPVDEESRDVHFTYLDTYGRPVLKLTKKNVIAEHNQYVQITYRFSSTTMLQEPILLVGAYFLLFVFILLVSRLNLNISPDNSAELRHKIDTLVARVHQIRDHRNKIHTAIREATEKVNKSKNIPQYNAEIKKQEAALSKLQADAVVIANELEALDAGRAEQLRLIERVEESRQGYLDSWVAAEASNRDKKTPKSEAAIANADKQYRGSEDELRTLYDEL